MTMLASDANNPDFVGATNPDDRLHVTFYNKPVENRYRTQQEGRPIFDDVIFVTIRVPGDDKTVIDTPARDDHKQRFPRQWAHFQNTRDGSDAAIGTPLKVWPLVTPAQAEELHALKFRTVEQVATASDDQINKIGMLAGMSPYAFRSRAQAWLAAAKDSSLVERQAQALVEKDEQMRKMTESMQAMQEQIAALASQMATARKPGRPRKVDEDKAA